MERLRDLGDALNHLTTSQKVALGVAVPAAMVTGYLLVKRNQGQRLEDEFEQEEAAKSMATSRQTTIEVKVPRRVVGAVIGRQGANIKQVQEISGARVNFRDEAGLEENEDRVVIIRGAPEKAQEAERLIHKIIADQPVILTEEIHLPQRALGRIIGKNGDTIRQLCRTSHAKIKIDRGGDERSPDCVKLATITGTKEQIEHARGLLEEKIAEEEAFRQRLIMIDMCCLVCVGSRVFLKRRWQRRRPSDRGGLLEEKIAEEEAFRQRLSISTSNRQHRRGAERPGTRERQAGTRQPRTHQQEAQEAKKLSPTSPPNSPLPQHNDFFEVFVSAVETPGHFWVQMVNAKAAQLDRLVQDMSDYYSEEHVKELEPIHTLMVGDIVAAPFQHDDAWYRARVMGFWKAGTLDLYYVDYGDSGVVKRENLRALRHDFLSLPFQAVECSLAGVAPRGEDWSEQATDLFEELTYCAKWKILMAKTVTYIQRDLQLMPCLLLVNTHGPKDVYIARELVKQGYAVRVKDSDTEGSTSSTPSEPDPNCVYLAESPVLGKPGAEHSDISAQNATRQEEPPKSTLTLSLNQKKTPTTGGEQSDLHVSIKLKEEKPLSPPGGRNVSKISIATTQGNAKNQAQDAVHNTGKLLEEKLETLERHREKFISEGGKEKDSQDNKSEDSSQGYVDLLTPISEKSNESLKEEESKEQIQEPADSHQDSALLTTGASGSERNIRVSVDSDSSMSAADMKALRSELASQLVEASVVRNGVLHPSVESEPLDDVGNNSSEKDADAVTPDFISSTFTSETSVFTTASGVSDLSSPSSDLDDTKHGAAAPELNYLLPQLDVVGKDSCASSPYISDEDMYTEGSSEEEVSTKSRSGVRPKVGSAEVSRHLGSAKEDTVTIPTVEVTAPATFDLTSSSDGDVYLDAEGQDYSTFADGEVEGAEGPLQLVDPDTLAEKVVPGKYDEDRTKETTGE
ncbi:tudor and KH domain-containing protein-like [Branchiostoma floridae]|uniref:Tudor and KH domain-containing protein-like n=1 Tax=Branchiostoma floridae TaxID=7739 RepID=A0A9J7KRG1_BRAFL|nr:tudor and KH domain-containing protein-like [Branchiostoma floridae]